MSLTFPAYDPQATYSAGDVVTFAGGTFACIMPAGGVVDGVEPGTDPTAWARILVALADAPATRDWVRARWADAREIPDATLDELLAAAWSRCVEFVPDAQRAAYEAGTLPGGVLLRWREANMLDARDLWRAAQRDGDVVAFDSYAMRVRALSDAVRSLLRPRRGVPVVG